MGNPDGDLKVLYCSYPLEDEYTEIFSKESTPEYYKASSALDIVRAGLFIIFLFFFTKHWSTFRLEQYNGICLTEQPAITLFSASVISLIKCGSVPVWKEGCQT